MLRDCFKKFFTYFDSNKKDFVKYSFLSFIVGVLELFGVALTYPFVLKLLSKEETSKTAIILGLGIIALFIAKNVFMIFYSSLQAKFTKSVEVEINLKFMQYFLATSYQESSAIPVAKKANILNFLIPNVINNFVLRLLNLNVNFFIFALISAFLVVKFPLATIITVVCAGLLIGIQNSFFKPRLEKISKKVSDASVMYTQRSNEVLLNIKGVKVSNNEKYFFENYKSAILDFARISRETLFLNTIPPYVTEPFIIILLFVLLSIISLQNYAEPDKLVASFAVIVSAIFRLAPTISRIQVNLNGINSALPIVDELFTEYENFDMQNLKPLDQKEFIPLDSSIELRGVGFEYEPEKPVLKNISLTINKGEFIGIAGLSGAGKTTLIDIISGLLEIKSGEIFIDSKKYDSFPPLKIGYIPQEISLINASIRENVAFGSPSIDDNQVIDALKKACLYDFVTQNYKDGIYANPFVDATGFSQGQKQRLAIARALYSNPDILILDEATSSLDLKTEDEICNVLNSLKGEKTIIAIAHRISTIKTADRIAYIKNAEIVDIAACEELSSINPEFSELVRLASF